MKLTPLILTVSVSFVFFLGACSKEKEASAATKGAAAVSAGSTPLVSQSQQQQLKPLDYSEAAVRKFFSDHVETIFVDGFLNRKLEYPTILARYDKLTQLIQARYGKMFDIRMDKNFNPVSPLVAESAGVEKGSPYVGLILPAFMNIHRELIAENGDELGKKLFRQSIIVGFMHELDHLAFGFVTPEGSPKDHAKSLENETRAWAETCENTISELVRLKLQLGPNEVTYYSAWVASDRSVSSPSWIAFIRNAYSVTK